VPLKQWDIAAGMAICREAGLATELLPPAPNGLQPRVLAGPGHLVREFKGVLESIGG
jgi:Archaeal fructose-1,6-bisphosphatase and related enzymes of inositol monophosphatase family